MSAALPDHGKCIRLLIRMRGLKEKDVAAAIGMYPTHFSEMLHGRRRLTAKAAVPLAKVIKTEPARILYWQAEWECRIVENGGVVAYDGAEKIKNKNFKKQ